MLFKSRRIRQLEEHYFIVGDEAVITPQVMNTHYGELEDGP